MTIRVGIIDDQSLLVSAFSVLVETAADMTVVATAHSGAQGIDLALQNDIDVLLMDVKMPDMSGLEATRIITSRGQAPRVLMLTTFNINEYVTEALKSGARGFILKDADSEELLDAIRSVHAGQMVLSEEASHHIADALRRLPDKREDAVEFISDDEVKSDGPTALYPTLTHRERQVLNLVGLGNTNPEISRSLFIAETTVKSHVSNLLSKLGCRDRVALAVLANRPGAGMPPRAE